MLSKLVFVVTQKLAVLLVAGLPVLGGVLTMGSANHTPRIQQTAIIGTIGIASVATLPASTTPATPAIELPSISPDLLATATSTVPFCTASSTCGEKGLAKLVRELNLAAKKPVAIQTLTTAKITPNVTTTSAQPVAPLQPVTAQSFLANTASSFKVLLDGSDELVFTTNIPGEAPLTWGLLTATLGGGANSNGTNNTNSIPEFSVTSSCAPVPTQPFAGAVDQNPTFNVRTAYDCTVALTPQSGSNRVTQSRDFSFTTPPGDFVVTPDTTPNMLLVNNTNNGGVIFNNQDSNPITITGITFNASYSYLNTLGEIPLILRFQNPVSGAALADYTPTNPITTDVTLPISLTIPPLSQKFLPIQVLGVQKMLVLNTTPSVSITLTGVTIDRSDIKIVLHDPSITWSCEVTSQSYDPNATSGAYATGQACLQ